MHLSASQGFPRWLACSILILLLIPRAAPEILVSWRSCRSRARPQLPGLGVRIGTCSVPRFGSDVCSSSGIRDRLLFDIGTELVGGIFLLRVSRRVATTALPLLVFVFCFSFFVFRFFLQDLQPLMRQVLEHMLDTRFRASESRDQVFHCPCFFRIFRTFSVVSNAPSVFAPLVRRDLCRSRKR